MASHDSVKMYAKFYDKEANISLHDICIFVNIIKYVYSSFDYSLHNVAKPVDKMVFSCFLHKIIALSIITLLQLIFIADACQIF